MEKRTILGLDLGTNSIGWAITERNNSTLDGKILGLGSRIIPMPQDVLGKFSQGVTESETANRTKLRGVRRLRERHLLRRERLHRVLHELGILPAHYDESIDFEKRFGKFIGDTEPKITLDNTGKFVFQSSYNEMLSDFISRHPALKKNGKRIPHDWTIYFLRKKALSQKISDQELAWILLHFNQKRGYYQLRGEEEDEKVNKKEEFHSLKIVDVIPDEEEKKGEKWYNLILENDWVYRRKSKISLDDWKGKVRDFIVTTTLNEDGTDKTDEEGNVSRSFRSPKEDDWGLLKKKTEDQLSKSGKTVGEFIYDTVLSAPTQKIRGKLIRTIERYYYKDELKEILTKQRSLHEKLNNKEALERCVKLLYPKNIPHQQILLGKDFVHLFVEDIIFYQRPLKSKKSLISNCSLERYRILKDGEETFIPIKSIPKSNPLYQEFRVWQWLQNLRIYQEETDVTHEFLPNREARVALFEFLMSKAKLTQDALCKYLVEQKRGIKGKAASAEAFKYRWNYVPDKEYPLNETRYLISSKLEKLENIPEDFLTPAIEYQLWHIIYSVTDKIQYEKTLVNFAKKHGLNEQTFLDLFKRVKPFDSGYGAFSEKAIKRLLPLLREGTHWKWEAVDAKTQQRIEHLITGEWDEKIANRVREKAIELTTESHFQGLPLWLASYVIYNRHSESGDAQQWKSIQELETYLSNFRQHDLRNPIVERVILETLRVVRDLWKQFGDGKDSFFDEIHVELGRDMKNSSDKRKSMTANISRNEQTNLRIQALLMEFSTDHSIQNVRPYSPYQQELLKIYEDGALNSGAPLTAEIEKISKSSDPSKNDVIRYKSWLEQNYRSPYTGKTIPISRLFTADYEIEHIIPKSRYYDDSFNNKVVCEAAVNKLKDNQTGMEFILNHGGEKVELGLGKNVTLFSVEDYELFVKKNYAHNSTKKLMLLSEELPEKMIQRQLNDTRYISKFVSSILSNIVRGDKDDDGVNSTHLIPGGGKITSELRQDWGLNNLWNQLVLGRFERMNELSGTSEFTSKSERHNAIIPTVPFRLKKGFQKKRIDHRHHAIDALVMACCTRDHVNYLNNVHALNKSDSNDDKKGKRRDLRTKLCEKKGDEWHFKLPWKTFWQEAETHLNAVVVSFKQNTRVITRATNKYEKWQEINGEWVKTTVAQTKGDRWAIRKPLHRDTVYGAVQLRERKNVRLSEAIDFVDQIVHSPLKHYLKEQLEQGLTKKQLISTLKEDGNRFDDKDITKVDVYRFSEEDKYVASRVSLDTSFNLKKIETITDTGIQQILQRHLVKYEGKKDAVGKPIAPELLAFSPEGIDEMNASISELNKGKSHQPIYKVRTYEPRGLKFSVGQTGNKDKKFVIAQKGTNLFFGIYADEDGKRSYETIPLEVVIERKKQGLSPVPEENNGNHLLFYLSPNDLVYVPEDGETDVKLTTVKRQRIYKMVSATGKQCFFVQHYVATSIVDKVEFSALNKTEKSIDNIMIKSVCHKLMVDRIGFIKRITS